MDRTELFFLSLTLKTRNRDKAVVVITKVHSCNEVCCCSESDFHSECAFQYLKIMTILAELGQHAVISVRKVLVTGLRCVGFTFRFVCCAAGCGAGCFLSSVCLRQCPQESHQPVAPEPPAACQSDRSLTPELTLVEQ